MVYLRLRQEKEHLYYWQELHQSELGFVTVNGTDITLYQIFLLGCELRHEKALENFYLAFPQC